MDLMRGVKREGAVIFVSLPQDCLGDPNRYLNLSRKICWMIEDAGGVGEWIEPDYKVLGVFGLPVYTPDYVDRAMNTAIEIRELGVGFRISVNVGNFFLATLGTPHHPTIFGETVNIASKILERAGIGEIVVTEGVYKLCRYGYELSPENGNYRLIRSRDSFLWRLPLMEREEELKTIEQLFESSMKGKTTWVGIKGPFGIGKSKIKEELKVKALKFGTVVLEVACSAFGPIQFLKPLAKLVNQILEFANGEIKVQADLFSNSLGLKSPYSRTMMVPFANRLPFTDYGDLYGSVVEILNLLARRFTFLVVIEDAHLVDGGTIELLKVIKGRLINQPVFFLLIYENDRLITDLKSEDFHEVELKPLSEDAVKRIAESIYKDRKVDIDVYQISGGNPYYTIQVLKHPDFYERGDQDPTIFRRQILFERIDRIAPTIRETLYAASIAGEGFDNEWLFRLVNRPVENDISSLVDAGFIVNIGNQFIFADHEVRDFVYEMIAHEDKVDLHNRLGRILESMYHDKIYDFAEVIAYHFSQCGDYEKASYYLQLAGDKALSLSQLERAVELYHRAIDYLDILNPRDNFYRKMRADIGDNLARILDYLGDYNTLKEVGEESAAIAGRWKMKEAQTRAVLSLAKGLVGIGDFDSAMKKLEQVLRMSPKKGDITASAQALSGYIHFLNQNYGRALASFNNSLKSAVSENLIHFNLINLITLHKELGNFKRAHEYIQDGLKGNPSLFFQINYHLMLGEIYNMLNATTLAEGELYWAYSEAKRVNAIRFEVEAGIHRLIAQVLHKDLDHELLASVKKILPLIKGKRASSILRFQFLLTTPIERRDEIQRLIPDLLELSEYSTILSAYIILARFDSENSHHWSGKAVDLADELQLPFYLAQSYYWFGKSLREGDSERAKYLNRCKALLDGLIAEAGHFGELIRMMPEYRGLTKK